MGWRHVYGRLQNDNESLLIDSRGSPNGHLLPESNFLVVNTCRQNVFLVPSRSPDRQEISRMAMLHAFQPWPTLPVITSLNRPGSDLSLDATS